MSVLIKGMEMPKDGCKDCIFVNRKWCGDICPFLKRGVTGNVERGGFQTDCPLVSVPPHGRLIDGDVAEAISFTAEDAEGRDFYDGILYAADCISKQPTIIPAEKDGAK